MSFSSLEVSVEMLGMTENYPNIQRNVFFSLDSKPLIKKFMVLLLIFIDFICYTYSFNHGKFRIN